MSRIEALIVETLTTLPAQPGGVPAAGDAKAAAGLGALHALLAPQNLKDVLRLLNSDPFVALGKLNLERWVSQTTAAATPAASATTLQRGSQQTINQGDYKHIELGQSGKKLSSSGCFVASLTMGANRINGTSYDLAQANARITAADGYSGAKIKVDTAAQALGLTVHGRRAVGPGELDALTTELPSPGEAAAPKKLAFAGVNYRGDTGNSAISDADHFLLLAEHDAARGTIKGVDPAGGREIVFRRQPDGMYTCQTPRGRYEIAEVGFLTAAVPPNKKPALRV